MVQTCFKVLSILRGSEWYVCNETIILLVYFLLTSVEINPLASEFPPQYPEARFGVLMNNCPTAPGLSTGCNSSSKIYAAEFKTGIPIGTFLKIQGRFNLLNKTNVASYVRRKTEL